MERDPAAADSLYRTLAGAVVPRPTAWVSTRDADATPNLAPYSFFTVAAVDPPTLSFSPSKVEGRKDAARNVRDTGEFVVNVVTADPAEAMNATSASLPAGESEFDRADVTPTDAAAVDAPRVAESPVCFECVREEVVDLGGSDLVLGRVVHVGVDDAVTTDGELGTGNSTPWDDCRGATTETRATDSRCRGRSGAGRTRRAPNAHATRCRLTR